MHAPFEALLENNTRRIAYRGGKVFAAVPEIQKIAFDNINSDFKNLFCEQQLHLHKIDAAIFSSAVRYFNAIGADWCNLPLSTRMISSPGEVYAGQVLNYTTDALPIELSWFECPERIFLSESSQFYLELRLMLKNVDRVFSIYNSFRKEPADYSHLSEFQHIEFEGKVSAEINVEIALGLLRALTDGVINQCRDSLRFFLTDLQVESLSSAFRADKFVKLSFRDALNCLREDTRDERYAEFSLKNFGSWEEVRLSQVLGKHVILTEFPLLQIPFYHNATTTTVEGVSVAENADIIFYGYREVVGAGVRISNIEALINKAKVFCLPLDAYAPYLDMRRSPQYSPTAGFGLGWQRFTQWLLNLPAIWHSSQVPRGHTLPYP